MIASALGGAGDKINIIRQSQMLNRGDWRSMEREFQKALDEGKSISVKIEVGSPAGTGIWPNDFFVMALIDGVKREFPFRQ